ncbi:MAG: hypothetical protein HPY59_00390 [Anaerolineae bacterium]|nr:hypothetical protein [Anaerolineae bacterium]
MKELLEAAQSRIVVNRLMYFAAGFSLLLCGGVSQLRGQDSALLTT